MNFFLLLELVAVPSKLSNIILSNVTATSISISWRIPNDSVVENYELMWEKDTTSECPDVDESNITIPNTSTSYTIIELEKGSSYIITVTASNAAGNAISDRIIVMTSEAGE